MATAAVNKRDRIIGENFFEELNALPTKTKHEYGIKTEFLKADGVADLLGTTQPKLVSAMLNGTLPIGMVFQGRKTKAMVIKQRLILYFLGADLFDAEMMEADICNDLTERIKAIQTITKYERGINVEFLTLTEASKFFNTSAVNIPSAMTNGTFPVGIVFRGLETKTRLIKQRLILYLLGADLYSKIRFPQ